LPWETVTFAPAEEAAALARLQADPAVVAVTPDYPLFPAYLPDDPAIRSGEQWAPARLGLDVAWEISSGEAITVAVLDSGIDIHHPDLRGQWIPGYNFFDDNGNIDDGCGHGTHVAGIVAATANNRRGVSGVAPKAILLPVKVIGDECWGSYGRLIDGIRYAVARGARILVIASGGSVAQDALHDAIRFARRQGVLVAVAAGNRASRLPFYPGNYAESFTVAGTTAQDTVYANSNYGSQIDVAAPAANIFSTYVDDGVSGYAYLTGTSMAAPHVAGLAALVWAVQPDLPLGRVEKLLGQTADDLGAPGWDETFGFGRINAQRALAAFGPAGQTGTRHTTFLPFVAP
jgi:subtilisin family serine protease